MKKMTYKTKIGILALEIIITQPKVGLWLEILKKNRTKYVNIILNITLKYLKTIALINFLRMFVAASRIKKYN
jgi:hypothetical protein